MGDTSALTFEAALLVCTGSLCSVASRLAAAYITVGVEETDIARFAARQSQALIIKSSSIPDKSTVWHGIKNGSYNMVLQSYSDFLGWFEVVEVEVDDPLMANLEGF